jgi:hypothetical protein
MWSTITAPLLYSLLHSIKKTHKTLKEKQGQDRQSSIENMTSMYE